MHRLREVIEVVYFERKKPELKTNLTHAPMVYVCQQKVLFVEETEPNFNVFTC